VKHDPEPRVRHLWDDEVTDPLAWLENAEDPEVLALLESENRRVVETMSRLDGLKDTIFHEIKDRVQETDLSVPLLKDDWEYYGRTEEGLQYGMHCRRRATESGGPEVVIIDENELAAGHDYFDLGVYDISKDHRLCLYGIDTEGDEKYELYLLDIGSGERRHLGIVGVSAGSAWDNPGTSFFYVRPDETRRPSEVWRHLLGTDPAEDRCVYVEPDPQFFLGLGKDRDDSFIHITLGSAVTDETRLIPADDPGSEPIVVIPRRFGTEYGVAHHTEPGGGGRFFLHTNVDAVNFRLLSAPDEVVLSGSAPPENWTEVVAHREEVTLAGFDVFVNHLVLVERNNGLLQLRIRRFSDGDEHVIDQPEEVSTVFPGANPSADTVDFRYIYTSMVTPPTVYSYDMDRRARTILKQTPVLGGFDSATYATERIWATAEDGTEVPILLAWRRDRDDGPHPAVLYGYGAYEAAMDPAFSIARLSLLDRGFTFAIAQVRGGGELGRRWYEAGKYEHKTRSFGDFVACARELLGRGLTTAAQLGIRGGSAGGLLVGAALNFAPDLFGAVVAEVPFVDVVNTMIDTTQQLTQIEWDEWGNPLESEGIYRAMTAYSPYENVGGGAYPPVYVTAGLNDPRVRFWEPAKWVLRLRERNTGASPILLKTEMGAGHFGSTGRYDAWRDEAEILAFLVDALAATSAPGGIDRREPVG
jgi:oligopeptidase B